MNDQLIVLKSNVGMVSESRVQDFRNKFFEIQKNSKELEEMGKNSSIDLQLNSDGVLINIRNNENHVDIHSEFDALIDAVIDTLKTIYVDSIELLQLDYFNSFKVSKTVINADAELDNEFELEGIVGKGYKFGITRNGLKSDLVIEPDYFEFNNSGDQRMTVNFKTGIPIEGDLTTSVKEGIKEADENYLYFLSKARDFYSR